MAQIEDLVPMGRYQRQAMLNASVRPNTDFGCTDDEFFAGTGRLVRIRPPQAQDHTGQVQSVMMIGLKPMIVVMRSSPEAKPRPVALMGMTEDEHAGLIAELPRMGEDAIRELLCGSPKTIYRAPVRWWPI